MKYAEKIISFLHNSNRTHCEGDQENIYYSVVIN